jgi:hemoglobin
MNPTKATPATALPLAPDARAPGDRSRPRTTPHPGGGAAGGRPQTPPGPDRPDLAGDADLRGVLETFYAALGRDPLLAPYFAELDMAAHLPRIADFWSTLLFRTGRYDGNVFRPHLAMPGLAARHFARWLDALEAAVRAAHAGPNAERMLDLAHRIAWSMQLRLGVAPGGPAGGPLGTAPAGGAPAASGGPA